MNTRKLINQTPVDEWELLNETVGRRPGPGTPLFEPHELGYACPVCDASDEVNITWSEFNGMIWCGKCKQDWPSCICKAYPEPNLSYKKLTKFQKARENKRVFVDCVYDPRLAAYEYLSYKKSHLEKGKIVGLARAEILYGGIAHNSAYVQSLGGVK